MKSLVRSLRTQFVFPTVRGVIADANERASARAAGAPPGFRVVHFSVQGDHLHLIVEAADRRALSAGVLGLAVSLARRINQLVFRRGRLLADRWHGRALTSPRAVRHALVYVLGNHRKHHPEARGVDRCSSAPYFTGFRELRGAPPLHVRPDLVSPAAQARGSPVVAAQTWLLRLGWRRHGLISLRESPKTA